MVGGSFTAVVSTTGDGVTSVASNSGAVCTVGANGLTVTYVGVGTCSLTASVATGVNYLGATGTAQTFSVLGESAHRLDPVDLEPARRRRGGRQLHRGRVDHR